MKVLLCHNFYQQPGGEDQVFRDEGRLLESRGHEVVRFTMHNDDVDAMSRLGVARRTLWNQSAFDRLSELIERERPAVMHATNTFPLISPAAYSAARRRRVAVVQSLHNYRLLCPGAFFMRAGRVCEDCLGRRLAWPAVVHGCYRGSRAGSAVVAAMLARHRLEGTWTGAVDRYIALTEFGRRKFIEGGLPADKIAVKPNFVDPVPPPGPGNGGYALFVGRLAPEKGIDVLLHAWERIGAELPLKILGDGPLAGVVEQAAARSSAIEWRGHCPSEQVGAVMADAAFLVVPSLWYEGLPKTILESYARGTPVIASRLGSLEELVEPDWTGALFTPGDADDLAVQVRRLWGDPDRLQSMRGEARRRFEEKYTAPANYAALIEIYHRALAEAHSSGSRDGATPPPAVPSCH